MTTDEKKERIRTLSGHIARLCNEYIHEKGLLEKWEIVDPAKKDSYYKLLELLNHHMVLYLEDVIEWDNGLQEQIEVIQVHPEDTPVTVKVNRYDTTPSVMKTARDLLIFAVLP